MNSTTIIFQQIILLVFTITAITNHAIAQNNEPSPVTNATKCPDTQILGPRGPKGEKGYLGPRGQKGERGSIGATGYGQKGARGYRGPYGQKGERGSTGAIGLGQKGTKGARGYLGFSGLKGQKGTKSSGVTYTRWGHTQCRSGAMLLYSGRMAGGYARQRGGGTNFLCLPDNPQFYSSGSRHGEQHVYSKIYGTEYDYSINGGHDTNVPCAVCYASTQAVKLMIPGRYNCPSGWTREFYGYIMGASSGWTAHYRTTYECVDYSQKIIPRSESDIDGALLFHAEVVCNGFFNCPPYDATKEITCAVCTN